MAVCVFHRGLRGPQSSCLVRYWGVTRGRVESWPLEIPCASPVLCSAPHWPPTSAACGEVLSGLEGQCKVRGTRKSYPSPATQSYQAEGRQLKVKYVWLGIVKTDHFHHREMLFNFTMTCLLMKTFLL